MDVMQDKYHSGGGISKVTDMLRKRKKKKKSSTTKEISREFGKGLDAISKIRDRANPLK